MSGLFSVFASINAIYEYGSRFRAVSVRLESPFDTLSALAIDSAHVNEKLDDVVYCDHDSANHFAIRFRFAKFSEAHMYANACDHRSKSLS